jgi:hypothetical protein
MVSIGEPWTNRAYSGVYTRCKIENDLIGFHGLVPRQGREVLHKYMHKTYKNLHANDQVEVEGTCMQVTKWKWTEGGQLATK